MILTIRSHINEFSNELDDLDLKVTFDFVVL